MGKRVLLNLKEFFRFINWSLIWKQYLICRAEYRDILLCLVTERTKISDLVMFRVHVDKNRPVEKHSGRSKLTLG